MPRGQVCVVAATGSRNGKTAPQIFGKPKKGDHRSHSQIFPSPFFKFQDPWELESKDVHPLKMMRIGLYLLPRHLLAFWSVSKSFAQQRDSICYFTYASRSCSRSLPVLEPKSCISLDFLFSFVLVNARFASARGWYESMLFFFSCQDHKKVLKTMQRFFGATDSMVQSRRSILLLVSCFARNYIVAKYLIEKQDIQVDVDTLKMVANHPMLQKSEEGTKFLFLLMRGMNKAKTPERNLKKADNIKKNYGTMKLMNEFEKDRAKAFEKGNEPSKKFGNKNRGMEKSGEEKLSFLGVQPNENEIKEKELETTDESKMTSSEMILLELTSVPLMRRDFCELKRSHKERLIGVLYQKMNKFEEIDPSYALLTLFYSIAHKLHLARFCSACQECPRYGHIDKRENQKMGLVEEHFGAIEKTGVFLEIVYEHHPWSCSFCDKCRIIKDICLVILPSDFFGTRSPGSDSQIVCFPQLPTKFEKRTQEDNLKAKFEKTLVNQRTKEEKEAEDRQFQKKKAKKARYKARARKKGFETREQGLHNQEKPKEEVSGGVRGEEKEKESHPQPPRMAKEMLTSESEKEKINRYMGAIETTRKYREEEEREKERQRKEQFAKNEEKSTGTSDNNNNNNNNKKRRNRSSRAKRSEKNRLTVSNLLETTTVMKPRNRSFHSQQKEHHKHYNFCVSMGPIHWYYVDSLYWVAVSPELPHYDLFEKEVKNATKVHLRTSAQECSRNGIRRFVKPSNSTASAENKNKNNVDVFYLKTSTKWRAKSNLLTWECVIQKRLIQSYADDVEIDGARNRMRKIESSHARFKKKHDGKDQIQQEAGKKEKERKETEKGKKQKQEKKEKGEEEGEEEKSTRKTTQETCKKGNLQSPKFLFFDVHYSH